MIRLLAITPPAGRVETGWIQSFKEAAQALKIAVLLRPPSAAVVAACREHDVPLILSVHADDLRTDEVDGEGFAGIQIKGDPPRAALERARAALGDRIVARSVHGDGTDDRNHDLVDYTCFAPVFTPRTDPDKRAAGLDALRSWTVDPAAWVVALGGVTPSTAEPCLAGGARGLASISTFFGPPPIVPEDLHALVQAIARCSAGAPTPKTKRPDDGGRIGRGRPGSRG